MRNVRRTQYYQIDFIMHLYMFIRPLPLLLSLLPFPALAVGELQDLPELGSDASAVLTLQEEEKIGASFIRGLRRDGVIMDDPVINSYIASLGTRLANHSSNTRYSFRFFVIDAPSINAFALPAGYIGLHSGLIDAVNSESELASVVAHEIAHATQFHIHRAVDKGRQLNTPLTAALITALLLGAENPQAAELLLAASLAGSVESQLNYSRLQEQEADRIGIRILADTGFNPRSMPDFFETLHRKSRISESAVPEFMRTHPVTPSRITDSRMRAEQYPFSRFPDSFEFLLVKAHLKASSADDPRAMVSQYQKDLKASPKARDLQYGLALSHSRAGQPGKAAELIARLLTKDQERLPYLLLQATVFEQLGDKKRLHKLLSDTAELYPDNGYVITRLANTLLARNEPVQARTRLRDFLSRSGDDAGVYQLLGKAENSLGNAGAAYMALAQYHFLEGRFSYAMEHLRQAKRQTDLTEHDRSRIQDLMLTYNDAYQLEKHQREEQEREDQREKPLFRGSNP